MKLVTCRVNIDWCVMLSVLRLPIANSFQFSTIHLFHYHKFSVFNFLPNAEHTYALLTLVPTTTHSRSSNKISSFFSPILCSCSLSPSLFIVKNGSLYVMSSKRHLVYIRFYQHTRNLVRILFCAAKKSFFLCPTTQSELFQVQLSAILFVWIRISFKKKKKEIKITMPSLNNENESDGDGEMSDNESQHSNSSRDAKADSSEADEPDSDSSELNEEECERRTTSFIKHMGK